MAIVTVIIPKYIVESARLYAKRINKPVWVYWSARALDYHTTRYLDRIPSNDTAMLEVYPTGNFISMN